MAGFAVVRTGGKMYRVTPGQILVVEKIDGEGEVLLKEVLMVSDEAGTVFAQGEKSIGVSVRARILSQERDQKIIVFKKKKRKNYRRKQGHRQSVSRIRIEEIIRGA
ncbi:MAG: 50S ribosomal protein L21 [Leptospirillum sp.]|jgi:large subunit ribosomal protein L21